MQELELLRDKLRKYLGPAVDVSGVDARERAEIVLAALPFVDGSASYLSLSGFREWLALQREKTDPKELLALFRLAGFESETLWVGPRESRAGRRYWKVPLEWTA